MASITIRNLNKRYEMRAPLVVDNLDLDINEGDFIALIGDSGSGKTTILRMLAGLTKPTSGSISIGGKVVFSEGIEMTPEERKVGLVFQDSALFPHFTVRENILFGIENRPKTYKKQVLEEMLQLTNLEGLEGRYPHQISGGQKQRVALARALAVNPELLLLDEPFNGLDFSLKDQIMADIKTIVKKTGITTILVTHNRNEAFFMADRIAVLKSGKIHQYDEPYSIYNRPSDRYTAKFFGKANFIPGVVEGGEINTPLGNFNSSNTTQESPIVVLKPEDFTVSKSRGEIKATTVQSDFYGHYTELKVLVSGMDVPLIISVNSHFQIELGSEIWITPLKDLANIL